MANSHLDSFNSTLFASAEEQQKLKENMDQVQKGITSICKTAAEERRGYTQSEIKQLDEYFIKLRELNKREMEIQQQISAAITQQATTNAERFQGTLDEYKIQSQEWLKTATEQKDKTIELIGQQTIEEIALLNERYSTKELRQTEEYQKEYDKIIEQKNKKVQEANDEVAKVSSAYEQGYLDRSQKNESWYTTLQEYNKKIEDESTRHTNSLDTIQSAWYLTESNKLQSSRSENQNHEYNIKEIWKKMYKDMDESQEQQLGVWLAQVAQTELYGGEIDEETQKIVDSILDSYDQMPNGTKKSMKNAMQPMLEEMEKKEPSLYSKATGIANGILSRLQKSFDIHSPSRKTRAIMKNVMIPMEEEMEKGKEKLFKETDELTDGINKKLSNLDGEVDINSTSPSKINENSMNYNISEEKLFEIIFRAFLKALNSCKMELDEEGFIRLIKNELYEVL